MYHMPKLFPRIYYLALLYVYVQYVLVFFSQKAFCNPALTNRWGRLTSMVEAKIAAQYLFDTATEVRQVCKKNYYNTVFRIRIQSDHYFCPQVNILKLMIWIHFYTHCIRIFILIVGFLCDRYYEATHLFKD